MPPRSRRSMPAQSSPARPSRGRKVKDEPATPKTEIDEDENNNDDEDDEPGPSRRGSLRKTKPAKRRVKAGTSDTDDVDEPATKSQRRRSTKQVSYKEIPIDAPQDEESSDDEDEDEDEDDEEEDEPVVATPVRRGRGRPPKDKDAGDKPYKREPGTGGRGGFSVKGAAAAAARARWDKVRRERAERGEDPDAPKEKRITAPIKKDPRGALENVVKGQVYTIKGVEYTAGEDELILPENEKGNTKVDEEGRLLGGREYKLVTFTSPTRRNPNRLYALTIDAARACGYTDSLAFLRRCPQIVKLSCNPEEREMLINVGRITGNLKHRMVTMVAMRNVFKLMGARLVKNGKWVDDDYDEERAVTDCETNGWTPHGPVLDEELAVNQYPSAGGPGRPPANAGILAEAMASKTSLQSWYTVGGFTTQFGGNGMDPWSDLHAKRGKLRHLGVTEEDWILRTAEDSRRIDETLRGYREERLNQLEGDDALRGWVYVAEQRSAGEIKTEKEEPKHPLANEVTFEPPSEPLSPAPPENPTSEALGEVNKQADIDKTPGGKIIVESEEATTHGRLKMDKWVPGAVYAAYEPHTQMPHVPLHTQPTQGREDRLSFEPWIGLNGSAKPMNLPGFSSVEVVFDPSAPEEFMSDFTAFGDGTRGPGVVSKRLAMIEEAEEWERSLRAKRRRGTTAAEASGPSASVTPAL